MIRGLSPIKFKDHRTYDFHRTFGIATQIPQEFNFDTIGVFPNQNLDGLPNACTAYTVTGIASNEDKINYDDKDFTYLNTKLMMGVSGDVPCDQMTSLKSGTVYGVKTKPETPDQALNHRRAPYFIVKKLNGSYFDGVLSAMWIKQGTLSIGSPWLPQFETPHANGWVGFFNPPTSFTEGHNWECCGIKIIDGEQMIICKSWQGANYGDKGYCYFDKKNFDDILSVAGIGIFGQKHAEPSDIVLVKEDIITTIISYLYQWLNLLKNGLGSFLSPK